MSAKISPSADGTKIIIGTATDDILQLDTVAKTITALGPYTFLGVIGGSAFSAGASSAQSLTTTKAKVLFQTEFLDSDNSFDNSRFTPKVAGWYQISFRVQIDLTTSYLTAQLWKNGALFRAGSYIEASGLGYPTSIFSDIVYMNGTTDYLEVQAASGSGRSTSSPSGSYYACTFSGFFVRPAP